MGEIAIRVDHLSKQYKYDIESANDRHDKMGDKLAHGLRSLVGLARRPHISQSNFWALKDICLEVKQGEVIGLVGSNGAGKSTLLKILSRITGPTEGRAEIYGRMSSLLEVGTGFVGDLSGRDNIYLSGAILGMRKSEIDRRFDEIVEFSGIKEFIDTPVKRYSSGMYVRLGFSVAAHLEPDILVVDEVLAVGDAVFQRKCLGKMGEVAGGGRTILFVTHNMAAIEGLCTAACMFEHGRLVRRGSTREVIDAYLSSLQVTCNIPLIERTNRKGNGKLRFTDIMFLSGDGSPTDEIQCGQDVEFSVGYTSVNGNLRNVEMSVDIFAQNGQCMLILNNEMVGEDFGSVPPAGRFSCRVKRFPLAPGQYTITLFCRINGMIADWVKQAAYLPVGAGDFYGTGRLPPPSHGGFLSLQQWRVESQDAASSTGSDKEAR